MPRLVSVWVTSRTKDATLKVSLGTLQGRSMSEKYRKRTLLMQLNYAMGGRLAREN